MKCFNNQTSHVTKFIDTGKLVTDVSYNSTDNINSIVRQDPDGDSSVSTRSHFMEERPSVTSGIVSGTSKKYRVRSGSPRWLYNLTLCTLRWKMPDGVNGALLPVSQIKRDTLMRRRAADHLITRINSLLITSTGRFTIPTGQETRLSRKAGSRTSRAGTRLVRR